MMKKLLVIAVIAALASVGLAQGGGMRMMRGGNNLLGLARREDVAKEINVTADQKSKLDDLQQTMRSQMREAFQSMGGGNGAPPDRDAMQKMMQDMQDKQKAAMAGILDAGQMTRLKELSIQRQGNNAILDKDVQAALGLSDDQKAKIKDLQDKQMEAMQAIGQKVQNQEIDQDAARSAMTKNNDVMKTELGKILTSDQASKLAAMGGKPFTFDTSLDNQRGPGGN
jgi:hypothetical protein